MRIGIDADGVLTELERYLWDYGSKFLIDHNLDVSIDHTKYNTQGAFGWDEEKDTMFWKANYGHYCKSVSVKRFAPDVIKKLKQEGHEIYIITARGNDSFVDPKHKKRSDKMLIKWLKNNKIKYDKLIFTGEDKLKHCLDNEVDIMIEDCPANLKQISKVIPMICMHADYNAKVSGKNIIRCHTWYEVYNRINSVEIPKE